MLTEHFEIEEFACKDGTEVPEKYMKNLVKLVANLEVIRSHLESPLYIMSGYRTPNHNKMVGGAVQSQHLFAKAADIKSTSADPTFVYNLIEELIQDGHVSEGGLGLYSTFVHFDIRKNKARWEG